MTPVLEIRKESLPKLSTEALQLLADGRYSLFKIAVEDRPEIEYALRIGAADVFFLMADGEAVAENLPKFQIRGKVKIADCKPAFAVSNFSVG